MRYPRQDFYGQDERFRVALAITPVVLKELHKQQLNIVKIKEILPKEVAELSNLIILELKK